MDEILKLIVNVFKNSAVLSGKLASPFVRVERAFHVARARMDLLSFPK